MRLRKKSKLNRPPAAQRVFTTLFFIIFVILGFTLVYPLIWTVINAGKTGLEYMEDSFSFPTTYLFENFKNAFVNLSYNNVNFLEMYWNSIWMAVGNVVVNTFASVLPAYVMSKYRFPGKSTIYAIAIFIQVVPILGAGAARYKFYADFGFLDNPALWWINWLSGFDFAFVVLLGCFNSISWEYAESAFMDGATNFQTFRSVMLPQAKGTIGALMITSFVGAWNDYGTSLMYMKNYPTAALGIYTFQRESRYLANSMPLLFCAVILTAVPAIIMYACSQKMIMTNMSVGGLKG